MKLLLRLALIIDCILAIQFALVPNINHYPKPTSPADLISVCTTVDCGRQGGCMKCEFPPNCQYGEVVSVNCTSNPVCLQPVTAIREAECRFCWQTDPQEYTCEELRNCSAANVRPLRTTCEVFPHVICIGRRSFFKNVRCDWTNGYSWSKTMLLSVTLGGFGIDRFYLGLWKSAIGKMFSFGGLGLWTLVDIILIAAGYVGPADGSCYI